ncbi:phosphatidylglycerophosphatase A [Oligella ureolytica]|jgi:phosphatidylglycerophosphatase A|nr:phosphatidylglycerophosphatase A [Alcaligenaceae bacterium]HZJ97047.1 phosphatidylglycerophosphatase A [Oligella sp.]
MKEDSNVTMNPVQPSISWILKSPHRFLAFGFGSGLIRPAPGTWGTLLALLLWFPLSLLLQSDWLMGGFLAGCFLYGIYCSQKACDDLGVDDHGGIVWDEWVAFWLVLFITTPVASGPFWYLSYFVLFRIFDIIKPWPIKYFEKQFQNGFGVMFDDIIAALYVLFTVAVVIRLMEVILV